MNHMNQQNDGAVYTIRIMKAAQTDIRETHKYIANDLQNPVAAVRRIKDIEESIRSLMKMPSRFPLVPDKYLASKGIRMIVVKNHIIFFAVRNEIKAISILRVLYARRDWMRILRINEQEMHESN